MKKVPLNRVIIDEFAALALLSDEEVQILNARVRGWSQVKQCRELHIGSTTLQRRTRELKDKYECLSQLGYLPPNVRI